MAAEAQELQEIGAKCVREGYAVPFIYPSQVAKYVEWQVPHVVISLELPKT